MAVCGNPETPARQARIVECPRSNASLRTRTSTPTSSAVFVGVSTLVGHAFERLAADRPMPGVLALPSRGSVGAAIEDLVLLAECSVDGEWEGQVLFLPL